MINFDSRLIEFYVAGVSFLMLFPGANFDNDCEIRLYFMWNWIKQLLWVVSNAPMVPNLKFQF